MTARSSRRRMVLGTVWLLAGCTDGGPQPPGRASPFALVLADVGNVFAADGMAANDLWILTPSAIQHFDGSRLREVPLGNVNPLDLKYNLVVTPGRLWAGARCFVADGTAQDFSANLPADARIGRLYGGGHQAVWAAVDPDLLIEVETGRRFQVPGGAGWVAVIGANDVWNVSFDGRQQSHWDGQTVITTPIPNLPPEIQTTLETQVRPVTFVTNDAGEAVAPVGTGGAGTSNGSRYASGFRYFRASSRGVAAAVARPRAAWTDERAADYVGELGGWSPSSKPYFFAGRYSVDEGARRYDLVVMAEDDGAIVDEQEILAIDENCDDGVGDCDDLTHVAWMRDGGWAVVVYHRPPEGGARVDVWAGLP